MNLSLENMRPVIADLAALETKHLKIPSGEVGIARAEAAWPGIAAGVADITDKNEWAYQIQKRIRMAMRAPDGT
jgi:hypothetical protein